MKRVKDITLIWEHGGHKLSFEPARKDALYYVTLKNETDENRTVAMKHAQLLSLKEVIDQALEDTSQTVAWLHKGNEP